MYSREEIDNMKTGMKQVSKDVFYATVGRLNVHPHSWINEGWPYVSIFQTPNREVKGIVDKDRSYWVLSTLLENNHE